MDSERKRPVRSSPFPRAMMGSFSWWWWLNRWMRMGWVSSTCWSWVGGYIHGSSDLLDILVGMVGDELTQAKVQMRTSSLG